MSGAFGYRFCPLSVFPLPLLAWQIAQWSAKWALASDSNSGDAVNGFLSFFALDGTAKRRGVRATYVSSAEGWSRALKPRCTAIAAPATTRIKTTTPARALQLFACSLFVLTAAA